MSKPPSRASQAAVLLAVAVSLTASLSACYVVPIDPRTGQGYPVQRADARGDGASPANVTVVTPPASPAPPAPTVLNARLYPLNTQANKGGLLTAVVVDNNTGRGSFTLSYLGDTMQGESTRVDGSYAAFGRIYNEVLGLNQRSFSGRRGIANAYGGKGVNAQCEYLITGPGIGTGACQFSDGARYQIHFGS
ncbi:hypothetical protein [Rhizobacter sp. SG703]|uniref:hypothetical protein n=1 Tax=Rhizobacter sp. SG703 TaxID=2587140 RepID=UPI001446D6A4|nr:hypothetical protein [Rhizobacter sp. SG703]NKI94328.1 hypothetical protein [Rhizobacter sp. SG703]